MELTEGQVWVYRKREDSLYSKYLVIDYVKDGCFHCRETPIGKVTSFVCHGDDYLLDDECWKLIDSLEAFRWICSLYADLCAMKQEKTIGEKDAQNEMSKYQQIIKECRQVINAHNEEIESYKKRLSELLNENKKLKDSISCGADKQEKMLVLLQDGSTHFVKNGTEILFDRDNNVICVLNEKADTLALFDKDFVHGVMLTTMGNNDAIKTKTDLIP